MVEEIDLHGLTVEQARYELTNKINEVGNTVWEISVIHGYNNGTAIRDMVLRFKHPRIQKRILGDLNPGKTTLYLFH